MQFRHKDIWDYCMFVWQNKSHLLLLSVIWFHISAMIQFRKGILCRS